MSDEYLKGVPEFAERLGESTIRLSNAAPVRAVTAGLNPVGTVVGYGLEQAFPGMQKRPMKSFQRQHGPPQIDLNAPTVSMAPFPYAAGGGGGMEPTPGPAVAPLPAPSVAQGGGGVGLGGGANPMAGLRENMQNAQLATMEGMDQEAELQRDLGDAKVKRMEGIAAMQEQQAAHMEIDAKLQQQADFDAQQRHQAFMQRNEAIADDISKQQIDPNRLMRDKGAIEKTTFLMGSILGGALQGLRGGRNDTLDQLDAEIQRDIASQQSAIDNKKSGLAARQSLFGQMLQETGDSRVAAMQARNLMFEAFKSKLLSEGERLGTTEARVNSEIAARQIQAKQDVYREGMAATQLHQAQASAAAAAAQRAASEKAAWDRGMEVAKMGLEKDKLAIERMKAEKDMRGDADVNREIESAAKDLADPKLAQGRATIDALKGQFKSGDGIEGIGLGADIRANMLFGAGNRLFLSDQERVNRGNWEKLKLAYQNQITGSGASNEERAMISKAFEGAKTPAEQQFALKTAEALYKQVESRRIAGLSDAGRAEFARRMLRESGK